MNVVFEKFPVSLEEFQAMENYDLSKPENTVALFLCALDLFVKDRELGVEAINLLKGPVQLSQHDISFLADRFRDKPYMPKVFFDGAEPSNNYSPSEPFTLQLYEDPRPQDIEEGYLRLYLSTAGADSKRAVTLREKDGNWYLWAYPGLLSGVRTPVAEDPWA